MYRVLDIFSGIGGFSLGLDRTGGFRTVAFCEIDPFCRRVLAKHWPDVPRYEDVRTLTAERLASDGISPNVICGGFPCQDISLAGKGAGIAGERSGLWSEYARLVDELRPSYVIVENVAALLGRGLGTVLGDLAALGYDAEWHCIPASAVGAPHRRDRLWILAYPERANGGRRGISGPGEDCGALGARPPKEPFGSREALADAACERCGEAGQRRPDEQAQRLGWGSANVSDAHSSGLAERVMFPGNQGEARRAFARQVAALGDWWAVEPAVGRVAHGVPDRVGQLRAYGNAVVPQIPEMIGRAILEADQTQTA